MGGDGRGALGDHGRRLPGPYGPAGLPRNRPGNPPALSLRRAAPGRDHRRGRPSLRRPVLQPAWRALLVWRCLAARGGGARSDDIRLHRRSDGQPRLRRFHQARWDEPVIFELSTPGARGILIPEVEDDLAAAAGDVLAPIPQGLRRKTPPRLPEMSQVHVLRHYLRLSQETLGADLNIDVGQGTCTMH